MFTHRSQDLSLYYLLTSDARTCHLSSYWIPWQKSDLSLVVLRLKCIKMCLFGCVFGLKKVQCILKYCWLSAAVERKVNSWCGGIVFYSLSQKGTKRVFEHLMPFPFFFVWATACPSFRSQLVSATYLVTRGEVGLTEWRRRRAGECRDTTRRRTIN